MKTISGIYCIRNLLTDMIYIGSSVNINQRWNVHCDLLKKNIHKNAHLQNAYNKYGKESFVFEILIECDCKSLLDVEQEVIDSFSWDKIYNINPIAGSNLGKKHSKETKLKMSRARRGKKHSKETKIKISTAHKGKKLSDEHKKKLSEAHKGKKHTEETKISISKAIKNRYKLI